MKNKNGKVHIIAITIIVAVLFLTVFVVVVMFYKKNKNTQLDTQNTTIQETQNVDVVDKDKNSATFEISNVDVESNNISSEVDGDILNQDELNVVLILDASRYMSEQVKGNTLFDIAKKALEGQIAEFEKNVYVSLVVYGYDGGTTQVDKTKSCNSAEEIYYMGPVESAVILNKVNNLKSGGWAPLASSLERASGILEENSKLGQKKHIIIFAGGSDTCDDDPINVANVLRSEDIKIDVVGFDVDGTIKEELQKLASNGGGSYYYINNFEDIDIVIKKLTSGLFTNNSVNSKIDDSDSLVDGFNDVVNDIQIDDQNDQVNVSSPNTSVLSF